MALAVEWLPEEWPEGIPNLKQLLVVAPLTTSILLLFGCGNRNLRTVWLILGRVAALVPQDPPTSSGCPRSHRHFVLSERSGMGRRRGPRKDGARAGGALSGQDDSKAASSRRTARGGRPLPEFFVGDFCVG